MPLLSGAIGMQLLTRCLLFKMCCTSKRRQEKRRRTISGRESLQIPEFMLFFSRLPACRRAAAGAGDLYQSKIITALSSFLSTKSLECTCACEGESDKGLPNNSQESGERKYATSKAHLVHRISELRIMLPSLFPPFGMEKISIENCCSKISTSSSENRQHFIYSVFKACTRKECISEFWIIFCESHTAASSVTEFGSNECILVAADHMQYTLISMDFVLNLCTRPYQWQQEGECEDRVP